MIPKECKRLAEVDFPIRRSQPTRGKGKVCPLRASQHPPLVVGEASVGCMSSYADGSFAA